MEEGAEDEGHVAYQLCEGFVCWASVTAFVK